MKTAARASRPFCWRSQSGGLDRPGVTGGPVSCLDALRRCEGDPGCGGLVGLRKLAGLRRGRVVVGADHELGPGVGGAVERGGGIAPRSPLRWAAPEMS